MMKFFSELGSCYRPAAQPPSEEPTTQMAVTCNGSGHGTSSKRINEMTAGSKSKYVSHWRPALSVISEDGVITASESERKVPSEKKLPGNSRSTGKPRCFRSNDVSEYDYSRKSSMPMIIPSFSPTPFIF